MPFQVHGWPNVILHLDGDAFFVSVLQAVNPKLKGKPMVAGSERGIATAVSYEAKKYGIKRTMRIGEVRKLCPNCIILDSDYELYSLFSGKMFKILREFSPTVEEYSIDEAFADLKGLRRPLNMTYEEIGQNVKSKIENSLGISISVGISITKSLAKLASNSNKPSGFKMVSGKYIEEFLRDIGVGEIWGIGEQTTAYLNKLGVKTALEFAQKPEEFIKKFNKNLFEIWQEIRGDKIYNIDPRQKTIYKSMQKTQTFNPPSRDRDLLWAKLMGHIEEAFTRARYLRYQAGRLSIFLKTQDFRYLSTEIKLQEKTIYPMTIRKDLKQAFEKIYNPAKLYRATGCTISDLSDINDSSQQTLFADSNIETRAKKLYPILESKKVNFASSLFDKDRMIENKKKPKPVIPVISLETI